MNFKNNHIYNNNQYLFKALNLECLNIEKVPHKYSFTLQKNGRVVSVWSKQTDLIGNKFCELMKNSISLNEFGVTWYRYQSDDFALPKGVQDVILLWLNYGDYKKIEDFNQFEDKNRRKYLDESYECYVAAHWELLLGNMKSNIDILNKFNEDAYLESYEASYKLIKALHHSGKLLKYIPVYRVCAGGITLTRGVRASPKIEIPLFDYGYWANPNEKKYLIYFRARRGGVAARVLFESPNLDEAVSFYENTVIRAFETMDGNRYESSKWNCFNE